MDETLHDETLLTELRDAAIVTGCPVPQCDHFEVTVRNETAHALVLTSGAVAGSFDEAPDKGHVLRPWGADTFRVTSVHYPWQSGAATLRYQMADAPVGLTATGGPMGTCAAGAMLEGRDCERYACAIEGSRSGRTTIRLTEECGLN
ncbi:hypothetical protein [Streptomyces caatingaensis]|uniref:Uncharacterized protein n=1 Tax=Streptomyces caatingaensis TaxID=1678637 RepID=A0A0K9XE31_9ACTN|nr:hypothetical protein [Streptomyces caatingaensis]KNB51659.1 hypothetical protein AC230_15065 [Streptomyces caatingaensis]